MSTPLTQTEAFDAFREFVGTALTAQLPTVWTAYQAEALAQRPDLPYATVRWLRSRPLSSAPHTRVGDEVSAVEGQEFERFVQVVREGTVQLVIHGEGGHDMLDELLLLKMQHAQVKDLHDKRIAVRPLGDVLDLPELRDTHYEPTAAQEWAVIYTTQHEGRTGVIETVTAPTTYLPQKE